LFENSLSLPLSYNSVQQILSPVRPPSVFCVNNIITFAMTTRGIILLSLGCACVHVHSFSITRRVGVITVTTPVSGVLPVSKRTPRINPRLCVFAGNGGTENDFVAPLFDEIKDKPAAEVFARPWFYYKDTGNPEADRKLARQKASEQDRSRQRVFRNETVKEILSSFTNAEDLIDFFIDVAIRDVKTKIYPYTDFLSIEDLLDGFAVVCLGTDGAEELKRIKDRYVPLEISTNITQEAFPSVMPYDSRTPKVCFVLGSSGSGKTFFSVKHAALVGSSKSREKKSATLYVLPGCTPAFEKGNEVATEEKAENLINWIKEGIKKECRKTECKKLQMHISLVLDEAGSSLFQGYFEDRELVGAVLKELDQLASSVWLVISGTGLDAGAFPSQEGAFKFRMKSWKYEDLVLVLTSIIGSMKLQKTLLRPDCIVDALLCLSLYRALSENARSAYMMLAGICYFSGAVAPSPDAWVLRLSELAPVIVEDVVANYISGNGLQKLSVGERRRVAASVLHAVDAARRSRAKTKPDYFGLVTPDEMSCANSLIDSNVDSRQGGEVFIEPQKQTSILLSAALSIVCCSMLGVSVRVGSSFRVQELIASLFALGRKAVMLINTYQHDLDLTKLDCALAELKIVQVPNAIPLPRRDVKTISVPLLMRGEIWRNGENAPFGDVVTDYVVFQTKRTEDEDKARVVALWAELEKCGLLRHQPVDHPGRLALRALFMIWQGELGYVQTSPVAQSEADATPSVGQPSDSIAYPFNQLSIQKIKEAVTYLAIKQEKISEGEYGEWKIRNGTSWDDVSYPDHFPAKLTFVILTNADEITINGPRNLDGLTKSAKAKETAEERKKRLENWWKKFTVKATYLSDGNPWGGRLDFASLTRDPLLKPEQWDSLKKQWELFQEQILPNVEIVFLMG
jgi:hypothetical protein